MEKKKLPFGVRYCSFLNSLAMAGFALLGIFALIYFQMQGNTVMQELSAGVFPRQLWIFVISMLGFAQAYLTWERNEKLKRFDPSARVWQLFFCSLITFYGILNFSVGHALFAFGALCFIVFDPATKGVFQADSTNTSLRRGAGIGLLSIVLFVTTGALMQIAGTGSLIDMSSKIVDSTHPTVRKDPAIFNSVSQGSLADRIISDQPQAKGGFDRVIGEPPASSLKSDWAQIKAEFITGIENMIQASDETKTFQINTGEVIKAKLQLIMEDYYCVKTEDGKRIKIYKSAISGNKPR